MSVLHLPRALLQHCLLPPDGSPSIELVPWWPRQGLSAAHCLHCLQQLPGTCMSYHHGKVRCDAVAAAPNKRL